MKNSIKTVAGFAVLLGLFLFLPFCADAAEPEQLYTYQTGDDGVIITGCNGVLETELELPSELDGMPVTAVGSGAFWGAGSLVRVVLPETVKQVENNAFTSCVSLESVEAPGVRSVGDYAFYNCPELTELTLSGNLIYFGENAIGEQPVQISTPAKDGVGGWVRSYTIVKTASPEARYGSVDDVQMDDYKILLYGMLPTFISRDGWNSTPVSGRRGSVQTECRDLLDYCNQLGEAGLSKYLKPQTMERLEERREQMLTELEQSVQELERQLEAVR